VSREQVIHCIDEWHRDNGHMGQERTWGYCKENTTMSHRLLSSITTRPALLA
jgi:hypothetical protein